MFDSGGSKAISKSMLSSKAIGSAKADEGDAEERERERERDSRRKRREGDIFTGEVIEREREKALKTQKDRENKGERP